MLNRPFLRSPEPPRKLKGAECMCPTCGEIFASVRAFDDHRIGETSAKRCDLSKLNRDHKDRWTTLPLEQIQLNIKARAAAAQRAIEAVRERHATSQ